MYTLYQLLLVLLFYPLLPLLLCYVLVTGNHREGIRQRLTIYKSLPKTAQTRIWLHAASVGEVQAASLIIHELRQQIPACEIVLTTMTIHGRKFAEEQLDGVTCLLAPLDIPGIAGRAPRLINPDIYLCLETELWPVLLKKMKSRGVPVLLLNGRMSRRTIITYRKYSSLFQPVLANFNRLCLISEKDRQRFDSVGIDPARIEVTGNIKYDRMPPADTKEIRSHYEKVLDVKRGETVFISGSTHTGEEEILLPVFKGLCEISDPLWVVAPRHLQRLDALLKMFQQQGLGVDLLSELISGKQRDNRVVVVDTFGDLFKLYSVGTFIFCGGSLVDKRGHNIMEPALWGKCVFYGPSMDDFRDGRELLESAGAGFTVQSGKDLLTKIGILSANKGEYQKACNAAFATAKAQQGAVARQVDVVMDALAASG